jgi:hypothetical protein
MSNERKDEQQETREYAAPKVVDYGDLRDLTATTGGSFSDVNFGAPNSGNNGMSSP